MSKESYIANPIGNEIVAVLSNINPKKIEDKKGLKRCLEGILCEDDFEVLPGLTWQFEPHGHSTLFKRGNSFGDVHTFPEFGSLYLNFASTEKGEDPLKAYDITAEMLNAKNTYFLNKENKRRRIEVIDAVPEKEILVKYLSCVMHGIEYETAANREKVDSVINYAMDKSGFKREEKRNLLAALMKDPVPALIAEKLKESHVCLLTIPKSNSAFFSLYSCIGESHGMKTYDLLKDSLGASETYYNRRAVHVKKGVS